MNQIRLIKHRTLFVFSAIVLLLTLLLISPPTAMAQGTCTATTATQLANCITAAKQQQRP
ncbi:MAG: hypothetical protein GY764_07520 [Halieaceae bacterium]|nr:hypothetical protein [Halieaceae bacterium]